MKITHFDALAPICPTCRVRGRSDSSLRTGLVEAAQGNDITAGTLVCDACGALYPIIDGLPILVADVRRYICDNLFYLMARRDLTPALESVLGDACGAGAGIDAIRQHLSSYMWDHWAQYDPSESGSGPGDARPGGVVHALEACLGILPSDIPDGPILDVGCGPGRATAELATRTGRMTLGVDLSFSLARAGRQTIVDKHVRYPRRRIGVAYDRREFDVDIGDCSDVDVWICDALALPFHDRTFAMVAAINVLDCVASPSGGIAEIGRVTRSHGALGVAMPFDWSPQVTPIEHWLGGHSQLGPHMGDGNTVLRRLLNERYDGFRLEGCGTPREIPWHVRLHDRSCMHYSMHIAAARRVDLDPFV